MSFINLSRKSRKVNEVTGVCGQGMSNVFAAPPIKYFKIFCRLSAKTYQSLNITLPNPNLNPKNKRKQNDT